ncbi:hypothetical protein MLD38_011235 [Melastoma candidum]|uniref:Uncharacterized protein n=1 Tax=Melastoma candidum TaxID=119954 RepID=A0ACB9RAQ6_9MYRT|nr:hypothetical protein MLD38_011235 [Melastoma candidum]
MLGFLCARPTALTNPSLFYHHALRRLHLHFVRLNHRSSSPLSLPPPSPPSICNPILPPLGGFFGPPRPGEGSWNVSWDARPARWLHRPDSAWFLFGFCGFVPPIAYDPDSLEAAEQEEVLVSAKDVDGTTNTVEVDAKPAEEPAAHQDKLSDYRVTGVLADGRCLFRAIAHSACLRKGEEAPDDNRQRELADELRAQVVEELKKRREETEWFIEGDFDAYIKRIQEPYVWGGEPELLMASHVLKTPIWVYMIERSSGSLANIAKYGEEYKKDEGETPINILFHGYGHYEILDSLSE